MRFQVRFIASMAAGLALCGALMTTASAQSSSSSSNSVQQAPPQSAPAPVYISVDPLAGVRYDNRWDISAGVAYAHIKAGPTLLEGSNLGGGDLAGSFWFAKRWGVEGDFRPTFGTSGAAPNSESTYDIHGPFVAQYLFTVGPEWLGPHNKHGDLMAHVLVGGTYGDFERDLNGASPQVVGFYNSQVAPAALFGGHFDLNRSAHWVFRVTTDAVWTRYSTNYATNISPAGGRTNWNYSMSVGMAYKFKKTR